MHTLLLRGQSLTVERPPRAVGTAVGVVLALLALALAMALIVRATGWGMGFTQFLAFAGAGVLLLIAGLFAFWAYGCYSLRYMMDRTGLTIAWGPVKHFVSVDQIGKMVHGRSEHRPRAGGLSWLGYHVGRGEVEGLGEVLFFSTHRGPEELVYVQAGGVTYGLSPRDPIRFIAEAQRFLEAAKPEPAPAVQRALVAAHPIWADRVAQGLATASILLNVVLWGFVFAIYPSLNNEIAIEFPPIGDVTTLQPRSEFLKIPAAATAIVALDVAAALVFQWKERAAAYLLLSGGIFFQVMFWAAALVALKNA